MLVDPSSFERQVDALAHGAGRNEASIRVTVGNGTLESHVSVSTPGLLAIGGMVSSILLPAAVIVLAPKRRLPSGTLPRDLRRS